MASHLTDKQRAQIIAAYVNGGSLRQLAAKYGVSATTIQRVVKSDTTLKQKVARKKEENIVAVLEHMNTKKRDVCDLIDSLLVAMKDTTKIGATDLNKLAVTMGILIDKFTANENWKTGDTRDNNLFEAIRESAQGEMVTDDIPEIEQAAAAGADVVESSGIEAS